MTNKRPTLLKVAGTLVAKYIGIVAATSRKRSEPADLPAHLRAHHPLILAVWHGQFMMIPKLNREKLPTRIVVAKHGDAEVIGEAFARFNVELIRGAGAGERKKDRGGAQALRLAVTALRSGYSLSMTADVPPGPARKVGMGLITLARLSGRPIIPAAVASRRYIALKTWSRFTINLPFSKLGMVLGDPIYVPRSATPDDLEDIRLMTEQAMNDVTARAYALSGGDPRRSTPPRGALAAHPDFGKDLPALSRGLRNYRRATTLARPLAPLILSYRERKNKEDPLRRAERYGIASIPRPEGPLLWLHAASVGELNAILPLIDLLQARRSDINILVTTGTVTSAKLAGTRLQHRAIHQYLPLDAPRFVESFLDHWRPSLAAFTESEIWPNMITAAVTREIPLAIVNGRMSKKSFDRWQGKAAMATPLFGSFDLVLAQNNKFSRRFSDLGARHVSAVGNLKIDAPPLPIDEDLLAALRSQTNGRPIFIAASTHAGEEEQIAEAHKLLSKRADNPLTIIAPRHPERAGAIVKLLEGRGIKVAQRSRHDVITDDTAIYLADTIGELGSFYHFSSIALLGGSLIERGGQNPIEAIKCGALVLTGPNWGNFRDEYKALIKAKAVSEVSSAAELAVALGRLWDDAPAAAARRQAAEKAVEQLSGALERTLDALIPLLPAPTTDRATVGFKADHSTDALPAQGQRQGQVKGAPHQAVSGESQDSDTAQIEDGAAAQTESLIRASQ